MIRTAITRRLPRTPPITAEPAGIHHQSAKLRLFYGCRGSKTEFKPDFPLTDFTVEPSVIAWSIYY